MQRNTSRFHHVLLHRAHIPFAIRTTAGRQIETSEADASLFHPLPLILSYDTRTGDDELSGSHWEWVNTLWTLNYTILISFGVIFGLSSKSWDRSSQSESKRFSIFVTEI